MTAADDVPPDDHPASRGPEPYGAAPERTALAWQRTGLGLVIGCFLVFTSAVRLGITPMAVLAGGLGLLIAALAVFVFSTSRYLRGDPADAWRLLLVVAGAVIALGGLGAIAAVTTMLRS